MTSDASKKDNRLNALRQVYGADVSVVDLGIDEIVGEKKDDLSGIINKKTHVKRDGEYRKLCCYRP